jgi:hypothetical protein
MSRNALRYAAEKAANPEIIETNRKLFKGELNFTGYPVGTIDT